MAGVDYDAVAQNYQAGRSEVAQTAAWSAAVTPYLPRPGRGLRVLDLGAGTGIFTRAWPGWGASRVVAVDPSGAMLTEARRVGVPTEARLVVGRAEGLPLRADSLDVAWLSTVFHHFTDRARCIAELDRVLADGGVVLVRAHYPDCGAPSWFDVFPGADRALGRFPTLATVTEVFERGGFVRRGLELVAGGRAPAATLRDWARRMRNADSFLGALTDEEIAAGLESLEGAGTAELDLVSLHLAVFARRDPRR